MGLGFAEILFLVLMAAGGLILMVGLPLGIILVVRWINRDRGPASSSAPVSAQLLELRDDIKRLRADVERLKQAQASAELSVSAGRPGAASNRP
jgi:hypothetical protein